MTTSSVSAPFTTSSTVYISMESFIISSDNLATSRPGDSILGQIVTKSIWKIQWLFFEILHPHSSQRIKWALTPDHLATRSWTQSADTNGLSSYLSESVIVCECQLSLKITSPSRVCQISRTRSRAYANWLPSNPSYTTPQRSLYQHSTPNPTRSRETFCSTSECINNRMHGDTSGCIINICSLLPEHWPARGQSNSLAIRFLLVTRNSTGHENVCSRMFQMCQKMSKNPHLPSSKHLLLPVP